MTNNQPERTVEDCVEEIIDSLVADITYEKTWPAHTAYYQLDLNALQKSLKETLTAERQKRDEEIALAEKRGAEGATNDFFQELAKLADNGEDSGFSEGELNIHLDDVWKIKQTLTQPPHDQ